MSSRSNTFESLVEMNRLNNLSDGVFAIALTLLAFDIRLPEGVQVGDLPKNLLALAPKFMVYLISFVVIGGAWGAHQRMLNQIKRGDGLLVWFNLFCLLFVALLPASAAVLGRYPDTFLAITCFALDVALIQLTTLWLWRHASRSGLINPKLDPRVVVSIGRRLNLSTVIFLLSIPLALWNTWITYLFWVGLFILLFTTDWLSWQQATWSQQAFIPLEGAIRANVHVQHRVGFLKIDSEAEGEALLNGVFGGGLVSHVDRSDDATNIQLSVPERRGLLSIKYPWSWGPENALDWTLHLSDKIPLVLTIEISDGLSTCELGALQITDLKFSANSSVTEISLPDREGHITVSIEAKTASLTILVPADVAAFIYDHGEMDTSSAAIDLARFPMTEEGHAYRSGHYETASKRLDIHLDHSGSSVKIL
ncbi:MAG TPA: TMEM175 family protein [Anaerolineales bacterium]|nr:TMEM175 family protein [Anaerolineales bacterium]